MIVLSDTGFHAAEGDPTNLNLCQRGEWEDRMLVETVLSMLRIPRISATQSTGMLPRNPRECCHPVQRISAIDSTGMLPSSLRHGCHPRSVATLDRMISLGSLLLSMAVASAVHSFAVLPPGQQRRSSPMRRAPRPLDNAASRWSLGATRR
jgi:hypothetical protein